jgi:hypothetical protein
LRAVKVRIVPRARLHIVFQTIFNQRWPHARERTLVAFAFGAKRNVIHRRRRAELAAKVFLEMHGIAQGFVARPSQVHAMDLTGLKTQRGSACQPW